MARSVDSLAHLLDSAPAPAPAGPQLLPVAEALRDLFPAGGLKRGTVVAVSGSLALALAVVAEASSSGSWCAVVGIPELGALAASELGVVLDRTVLVDGSGADGSGADGSGADWAWTVAAVIDGFDLVLASVPRHLRPGDATRLASRARRRSSVLVLTGPGARAWPTAEVVLDLVHRRWEGLGEGHGRLRACRVEVRGSGRGASSRPRQVGLWLPGPDGRPAAPPS